MHKLLYGFILLGSMTACGPSYQKLHRQATVIDTHNDVLSTVTMSGKNIEEDLRGKSHSDLARFRQGGIDVQVFSIFCDETFGMDTAYKYANIEIDSLYAIVARNPGKMMIVTSPSQLHQAVSQGKLGCMMGVEGGHMMEDKMEYLEALYQRGVRYMTLTWNNSTSWASSAADETRRSDTAVRKGLTPFGRSVIQKMNQLGMIIDLSHVGEQSFHDAIELTTRPVIASHSCVYNLCPGFRNLKDDQIKAIGKNGGVIQLNFYSGFLDSNYRHKKAALIATHQREVDSLKQANMKNSRIDDWIFEHYPSEFQTIRPPLSLLMDHLDYIVRLIGVDHVGIGTDFDGIESTPQTMDDVASLPLFTKALLERGYSKKDVRKILGGNFIRVFEANQNKLP